MTGEILADLLILACCLAGLIVLAAQAAITRARFRRQLDELQRPPDPPDPPRA